MKKLLRYFLCRGVQFLGTLKRQIPGRGYFQKKCYDIAHSLLIPSLMRHHLCVPTVTGRDQRVEFP